MLQYKDISGWNKHLTLSHQIFIHYIVETPPSVYILIFCKWFWHVRIYRLGNNAPGLPGQPTDLISQLHESLMGRWQLRLMTNLNFETNFHTRRHGFHSWKIKLCTACDQGNGWLVWLYIQCDEWSFTIHNFTTKTVLSISFPQQQRQSSKDVPGLCNHEDVSISATVHGTQFVYEGMTIMQIRQRLHHAPAGSVFDICACLQNDGFFTIHNSSVNLAPFKMNFSRKGYDDKLSKDVQVLTIKCIFNM